MSNIKDPDQITRQSDLCLLRANCPDNLTTVNVCLIVSVDIRESFIRLECYSFINFALSVNRVKQGSYQDGISIL